MVVTREQEEREGQGDKPHGLATLDTATSQEAEHTGEVNLGTDSDRGQETAEGKCPQGWGHKTLEYRNKAKLKLESNALTEHSSGP